MQQAMKEAAATALREAAGLQSAAATRGAAAPVLEGLLPRAPPSAAPSAATAKLLSAQQLAVERARAAAGSDLLGRATEAEVGRQN